MITHQDRPIEDFADGLTLWDDLAHPIAIPARQNFRATLEFPNKSVVDLLNKISSGEIPESFAQIKFMLDVDHTRDIL